MSPQWSVPTDFRKFAVAPVSTMRAARNSET
jgi:hypothetical protein